MATGLQRVSLRNYRSLADVIVPLEPINVLFGPNGAGKSTFLDAIWFFRDCAIRGVELASAQRSHGIGLLYDAATEGATLGITISNRDFDYEVQVGLSSGRIEPYAGERLHSIARGKVLVDRKVGTDRSVFFHEAIDQCVDVTLREPEKLSLGLYLDFNQRDVRASELDRLLRFIRLYHARSFNFYGLKMRGSEVSHENRLWERCENAWSVLRNIHDRRSVDDRYDTIVEFMREAFPTFDGFVFDQAGPNSVYVSFLEKGRRSEIKASGVSDGHLQLLLLLVALYSEGDRHSSVVLFDEPEISLHPWAIAVFARAVRNAVRDWDRQVLIATHSPVLMSQFEPREILAAAVTEGQTSFRRLSDMREVEDLLQQYSVGSLFEAQMVGAQNPDTPE